MWKLKSYPKHKVSCTVVNNGSSCQLFTFLFAFGFYHTFNIVEWQMIFDYGKCIFKLNPLESIHSLSYNNDSHESIEMPWKKSEKVRNPDKMTTNAPALHNKIRTVRTPHLHVRSHTHTPHNYAHRQLDPSRCVQWTAEANSIDKLEMYIS